MKERIILHCDLNNFYASVECLYHPEWREIPIAVCGRTEDRHGIVLAKNGLAKAAGVQTGEPIFQAMRHCPELLPVPPHMEEYTKFSRWVNEIYKRYTDFVEPFSIDESWLDIGMLTHDIEGGRMIADEIRKVVREELGLTISIGVSFNKIFAKLGSELKKPDATSVISREDFREIVWPLSARELLFVGPATQRRLAKVGISTIGELAQAPLEMLRSLLGKPGETLYCYANGWDNSPVLSADEALPIKSVGNSTTMPRDLYSFEEAREVLFLLADKVAMRMRQYNVVAQTVQISIKGTDLRTFEHQGPLFEACCSGGAIARRAIELLRQVWEEHAPVRALGIRCCELLPCRYAHQLSLDSPRLAQEETVERCIDGLRERFGWLCIDRGTARLGYALYQPGANAAPVAMPFSREVLSECQNI